MCNFVVEYSKLKLMLSHVSKHMLRSVFVTSSVSIDAPSRGKLVNLLLIVGSVVFSSHPEYIKSRSTNALPGPCEEITNLTFTGSPWS